MGPILKILAAARSPSGRPPGASCSIGALLS